MVKIVKSVRINENINKIINYLGIDFSNLVNNYLNKSFLTMDGLNHQINYYESILEKLNKQKESLITNKKYMSEDEKNYLIETGEVIKINKKYLKPRIKAIYNLFGRVIENEEELNKLIELAKKQK